MNSQTNPPSGSQHASGRPLSLSQSDPVRGSGQSQELLPLRLIDFSGLTSIRATLKSAVASRLT